MRDWPTNTHFCRERHRHLHACRLGEPVGGRNSWLLGPCLLWLSWEFRAIRRAQRVGQEERHFEERRRDNRRNQEGHSEGDGWKCERPQSRARLLLRLYMLPAFRCSQRGPAIITDDPRLRSGEYIYVVFEAFVPRGLLHRRRSVTRVFFMSTEANRTHLPTGDGFESRQRYDELRWRVACLV